jgi:adenylate cyclase
LNISSKKYLFFLVTSIFLLVQILLFSLPAISNTWNSLFYDHMFKMRIKLQKTPPISTKIIHIDLNDETINDAIFKKSSKDFLAEVVKRLSNSGVKAIIFDMFFDGRTSQDALISVSKQYPLVYYPMVLRLDDSNKNEVIKTTQLLMPINGLVKSAKGLGHISVKQDSDGVIRKYPIVVKYKDQYLPSMALRVALDYFKVDLKSIELGDRFLKLPAAHLQDGTIFDINIPIDKQGNLTINFTGSWFKVFPHYSLKKILFANSEQLDNLYDELEGSIVIISDTSTWGKDFGNIPLGHMYPLSGVHSNVLNNILTQNFVRHTTFKETIFINLLIWIALVFFGSIKKISLFVISLSGLLLSIYLGALFCFINYSLLMPVMGLFISVGLSFVSLLLLRYLSQEWQKNLLLQKFSGYFSASLMKKIIDTPELINNVEEKSLAILFSDIAGFTSWCNTRDPETIRMVLNEYFSKMAPIVFKHQGTIDKYMGDGLMVFFGDPQELKNASHNAVKVALEMQKACEELRESWKNSDVMNLHIRIGVNFGGVVVGNMGSQDRMDYTVLGSHVNLAQRLESNAPIDGILISEAVYEAIKNFDVNLKSHADIQAKGFNKLIKTYTVGKES